MIRSFCCLQSLIYFYICNILAKTINRNYVRCVLKKVFVGFHGRGDFLFSFCGVGEVPVHTQCSQLHTWCWCVSSFSASCFPHVINAESMENRAPIQLIIFFKSNKTTTEPISCRSQGLQDKIKSNKTTTEPISCRSKGLQDKKNYLEK